jgi:hypothetical protein
MSMQRRTLGYGAAFRWAGIWLLVTLGVSACVATWIPPSPSRGNSGVVNEGLSDPLSMPADPTLSLVDFRSATFCATCHPDHYDEWSTSLHAYATKDPVWRALVTARHGYSDGERDLFCTQCHSSIGTRSGEIYPGFSFDETSPVIQEGVTCAACHKVVGLERVFNGGHVLDGQAAMHGSIEDPIPNAVHESEFSPLHDRSEFCGGCHDVIERHGLRLESPYVEWSDSPAAADGRSCQSCHMPTYTGRAASLLGVPERDDLHTHRFLAAEVPLSDDFITDPQRRDEIREDVITLLRGAGSIGLASAEQVAAGGPLVLQVTVDNRIDGHNLPTGSTFNRQMWIALTATDAAGTVIYQTGHLDENGDLRDYFSELDPNGDTDLVRFDSTLVDESGMPTLLSWLAAENLGEPLAPLESRTFAYSIPTTPNTEGPITVDARLRYRAFAPRVLRTLELDELVANLEIFDIDEATTTVDVD